MDFRHTSEQEMLRDSVSGALERADPASARRALAETGVFGILLAAEQGGLGLGAVEAAIVASEAGRHRIAGPVAETMAALPALASARPDLVDIILAGDLAVTAASTCTIAETGGRLRGEATVPWFDAQGWVALPVSGRVLLLCGQAGNATAQGELDLDAPTTRTTVDIAVADALVVEDVTFAHRLALLRVAEMVGSARRCFDLAVAYLKDRTQFGRAIGTNQSLKHMAADDFVRVETMRVALEYAAASHDLANSGKADPDELREAERALSVLMAYAPDAARAVAENAVQLHGGIGVTWDYAVNGYLRKILARGAALGWSGAHRRILADGLVADRAA